MVKFNKLDDIEDGATLDSLSKGALRDLQRALSYLGYGVGVIDAQIGPKTRNAWAEFAADHGGEGATSLTAAFLAGLKERIDSINEIIDEDHTNTEQVKTAIGAVCKQLGIGLKQQIAYVLATAEWETNHTFKPVKEAYWLSENWRKNHLSYYPFYGRGYVQLTWKRNYQKYSDIFDQDMVAQPDLALKEPVALFVIVHGFKTGTFTERKITEYINEHTTDYKNARRCINGLDKWPEIKALAEHYESQL